MPCKGLFAASLPATPQPSDGVTYARKIEKHEAALDWRHSAVALERRVRAFDPFPGATLIDGSQTVKVWRATVDAAGRGEPGEVLATLPGPLRVACGDGALELLELQRPGGRRVTGVTGLPGRPAPTRTATFTAGRLNCGGAGRIYRRSHHARTPPCSI